MAAEEAAPREEGHETEGVTGEAMAICELDLENAYGRFRRARAVGAARGCNKRIAALALAQWQPGPAVLWQRMPRGAWAADLASRGSFQGSRLAQVMFAFSLRQALIEARLKKDGTKFVKLSGSTKDRETPIREFQTGNVPVFLISLKAGGAGLNLTAADTVIHYDPWWNPAAEAQASDRAHRIGQTKPVFVHKLICEGTIEERIVKMQQKKAALVEGLLTGRTDKLQLTQADIQALFAVE
jgi:hypothetical protein